MPEKQPYPQAVLKNLPKEKQDAIWDYRFGKPRHTQLQTVQWLRDDGIQTSTGSLSYWERSYAVTRKMDDNQAVTEQLVERGKAEGWIKTAEEEQAIAQCFFTRLAAQDMDPKTWFLMQSLNLEKEKIALTAQKIEIERQKLRRKDTERFLEMLNDKRAAEIASGSASNSEKIEQLGALMFGEDWK
jgi:hypothetical protein